MPAPGVPGGSESVWRGTVGHVDRARFLHASGSSPMDESRPECHLGYMERPRSALPDEVHGARAAGALLVGDLASAEGYLACVRTRYLVGFLFRLAAVDGEAVGPLHLEHLACEPTAVPAWCLLAGVLAALLGAVHLGAREGEVPEVLREPRSGPPVPSA